MTNHLGNVLVVISDKRTAVCDEGVSYFEAEVLAAYDYAPFGMHLPERTWTADSVSYRYAFQGQEKDNEHLGDGNSYAFEYRIHDARLGRFLSVDPLHRDYPWNSSYAFSENCPIRFIELEGLEIAEPEIFQGANTMLDYYEGQINSGAMSNATIFTGLTMLDVIDMLRQQLSNPNSTSLNEFGWYCGPSAIVNVAINYNPMAYVSGVLDLAQKGVTSFYDNSPEIVVPQFIRDTDFSSWNRDVTLNKETALDVIFGGSLRASENGALKNAGRTDSELHEGTFPWEVDNMLRRIGIGVEHSSYWTGQGNKALKNIENAVKDGKLPIVFENKILTSISRQKSSGIYGRTGLHFIIIHSFVVNGDTVKIQYWDYGELTEMEFSKSEFLNGMKGYWIPVNQR